MFEMLVPVARWETAHKNKNGAWKPARKEGVVRSSRKSDCRLGLWSQEDRERGAQPEFVEGITREEARLMTRLWSWTPG